MARTVDPERHAARRLQIIDAAITAFGQGGYHGTSTAAICRQAGIGSGTFFHYFPTKQDVLLAILELGAGETAEWFEAQEGRDDPRAVLVDHVRRESVELADPRLAGFMTAVGSVLGEPRIAAALEREETSVHTHLTRWFAAAQEKDEVRSDVPAERLASWLVLLVDGFAGRIASSVRFDATTERPVLLQQVEALLEGPATPDHDRHAAHHHPPRASHHPPPASHHPPPPDTSDGGPRRSRAGYPGTLDTPDG